MLKENASVFKRLMMIFDALIVTASFFIAYHLVKVELGALRSYLVYLPVIVLAWLVLFSFFGMYWSFRTEKIYTIMFIIIETAGLGFMAFGSFLYVMKIQDLSRAFVVLIFVISALLMIVEKAFLITLFRYIRKKGKNTRNMLVMGTSKRAQKFIEMINSHAEWGFKLVGILDEDLSRKGHQVCGHTVIGSMIDLPDIIHNNVVDEVLFVVPRSWLSSLEGVIVFLETEGIRVHIAEDLFNLKHSRFKQTELHGFPVLSIENTPDNLWQLYFKRFLDFIVSGIALVTLSPVFLAIALAIKFTSKGPVFFRQERCGLHGRRFLLNKFRTMEQGAESRLKEMLSKNEMKGPVFKLANDPRVTSIGKFLRKFSLDELPQLWNVFIGEMSLVGPRPPLPAEVVEYDSWHRRRLSMKPGITCIWQCSGRNKIVDFDQWAKLDLEYIDTWSIWLDFRLIFKTVPAVIFAVGAK